MVKSFNSLEEDLRLTTNSNSGPASANFNPADFGGIADGDQVTVKVYNKVLDGGNPDPTACSSISSPVTVNIDPIPNATISSDKLIILFVTMSHLK